MLKNNLFLKALEGKSVERPPVWMMRQAGRTLPEYRKLREKYDFFTRCQTPELAAEITMQPIRRLKPDAAILFSDILVIPQAMGVEVELQENIGPVLPSPMRSKKDIQQIIIPDIRERLGYVLEAIKITKELLENEIPLIGFAGSPWTVFCYMVEGKGSKTFSKAKALCFSEPEVAHQLLQKITDTTIAYLKEKVKAGADVLQIFDSWGGLLSPADYQEFSWKYIHQIVEAVAEWAPVIVYGKGTWFALEKMSKSKVSGLGIDWTCTPELARKLTGGRVALQGNFDPSQLFAPLPDIKRKVHKMIEEFGPDNYIVNLGHGILPNVPVDHAQAFVDAVKSYKK
ncbi:MAG TPA: uroporphyrinogen decarboxylase [Sphingobacterium sp.]|nr:uroporphyrinogen decarboxylase [Sphingobacterium sp.]